MNVLLVGHGCQPNAGSEPGLTWNWADQLSKKHAVWVLTHPHSRGLIEDHLRQYPNPNLHFAFVELPRWLDPWNPATGEKHLRLHYLLWQKQAYRVAKRLNAWVGFDLIHHVGWGTVASAPPYWRLPVPFVWGPLGGGQSVPTEFAADMGRAWLPERIRKLRLALASLFLRGAARTSVLTLATNRETAAVLKSAGAKHVELYLDNGLTPAFLPAAPLIRPNRGKLRIVWAGRLERRKALPLLLEALAQVEPQYQVEVLVAGTGPEDANWRALADSLHLGGRVNFLGWVDRDQLRVLFAEADAFAFTSLRDGFGSVVLEAMAQSMPIICLDHQGVGCFVPPEAGVKVPVTTRTGTIAGLAQAVRLMATDADRRNEMGQAAWAAATSHSWQRRGEQMDLWYRRVVADTSRPTANAKNLSQATN